MSKLPALSDIYADKDLIVKNQELNIILNSPPKKEWIKAHPFVKNLKYIPIERLEYLMTSIFSQWNVEIKSAMLMGNSVVVIVRVHYKDPTTGGQLFQDGIGATPIQVNKGAGAIDFSQIKSSAIQMSAPSAETYAIKDAVEKIGKIFGKDLNRKDLIQYTDTLNKSIDSMTPFGQAKNMAKSLKGETKDSKDKFLDMYNELSIEEIDELKTILEYEVS